MYKLFLLVVFCNAAYLIAQNAIQLYKGVVPNSTEYHGREDTIFNGTKIAGFSGIITPSITIFKPTEKNKNGISVIIFPGGGYGALSYDGEGVVPAKYFAENGITAFVVKYRLPKDSSQKNKSIAPLQDAQQAIKIVREHCTEWHLDSNKIGIMGFSAGGHLASTLATHFQQSMIENAEHTNLRPDFLILVYPVITMKDPLAHKGSRENLLGKNPVDSVINYFSNETHVTGNTPPTILLHTSFDKVVDADNSIMFYEALRKSNWAIQQVHDSLNNTKLVPPFLMWQEGIKNAATLANRVVVQTPDKRLNALSSASASVIDAVWYPPVFVHGTMVGNGI